MNKGSAEVYKGSTKSLYLLGKRKFEGQKVDEPKQSPTLKKACLNSLADPTKSDHKNNLELILGGGHQELTDEEDYDQEDSL